MDFSSTVKSNNNSRNKKRKRGSPNNNSNNNDGSASGTTLPTTKQENRKNNTVLVIKQSSTNNNIKVDDKEEVVPPPTLSDGRSFLTSQDPSFTKYVQTHYKGFTHIPSKQLYPSDFHTRAKIIFERLRDANYYQYDIVMAGGKHTSRTFVKRTLVGEPGITYKYLGLRLFAHSWSGNGSESTPLLRSIGELNRYMIQMTKRLGETSSSDVGRCDYNLTLINYMEPTSRHNKVGFKEEANYGMGKVSVSWHADSSLEKNSSIGVYHCLPTQRSSTWDWRIALRPSPDSDSTATKMKTMATTASSKSSPPPMPVVVNTKDGDAYFLLGTFNEKYQHCVLAGSEANRISSTHRVAVTQEDTYEYILKRCKIARKRFRLQLEELPYDDVVAGTARGTTTVGPSTKTNLDAKVIRYCQQVLTEVEMEWIAQYWLQGAQHDAMHIWWQRPMKTLEAYWSALEEASYRLYEWCVRNQISENNNTVPIDVIKVLKNEFSHRQSLRQQWDERRADKIYQRRINPEYRPVARPQFDDDSTETKKDYDGGQVRLPKDLSSAIDVLTKILQDVTTITKRGGRMMPSDGPTTKESLTGDNKTPQLNGSKSQKSSSPAVPTGQRNCSNGVTPTLKKSKKNKKRRRK